MIKKGKTRLIVTINLELYYDLCIKANKLNKSKSQLVSEAIIDELNYLDAEELIDKQVDELYKAQEEKHKNNEK